MGVTTLTRPRLALSGKRPFATGCPRNTFRKQSFETGCKDGEGMHDRDAGCERSESFLLSLLALHNRRSKHPGGGKCREWWD